MSEHLGPNGGHRLLTDTRYGAARCECGWRSTYGWTKAEIPGQFRVHLNQVAAGNRPSGHRPYGGDDRDGAWV